MTQEEKAKAYDELLVKAKQIYNNKNDVLIIHTIEDLFPELRESEDERMRKELVGLVTWASSYSASGITTAEAKEMIAWLEKQKSVGEIVSRCKTSWYNEGKIAGMAEGLTDDEKYQQGWHDALEKQGEQILANSVKICKDEQKSVDKVEPKFKVGDEIKTKNEESLIITRIDRWGYWSEDLFICNFDDADKWELVEQKPWSEEDEHRLQSCLNILEAKSLLGNIDTINTKWLKSIKKRIGE